MKAKHNDEVWVSASKTYPEVWIDVDFDGGQKDTLMLSAKKARRLARKLNRAASAIEIRERDLTRYING